MSKDTKIKKAPEMSREKKIFSHDPVWKSVLKMSIPSMLMMLMFGLYTFMDNVLAINYANESNASAQMYTQKDLIRLYMAGIGPITTFIFAMTMLFGFGVSRRYSINLGAGREERAIKTMKTTMQIGLGVAILFIPILMFSAKPWMESQFSGDKHMASLIADKGFNYVWIIILAFPLQMFNQISSSLLRAEAKNKQVLIAIVVPLFINLGLDVLFMKGMNMGIEGGAWATFISYVLTAMLLSFYMLKLKDTRVTFKNTFGRKGFQWITIIGVVLVGIAPFMRNMAQSITQTIEIRQIQNVSQAVYGNNMQMSLIMTAVFPVFGLFFPMMFGFIQAGSPIAGYNYGAKNMKRVKQSVLWIIIYSTITAVILYFVSGYLLMEPLNHLLGIENHNIMMPQGSEGAKQFTNNGVGASTTIQQLPHMITYDGKFDSLDKAQNMYRIMFISAILFGPTLGALALFGSTDRVLLSLISSSLRGLILLIPMLFLFKGIVIGQTHDIYANNVGTHNMFSKEFEFWWFYPTLAGLTSLILMPPMIYTMKNLNKNKVTLEERIEKIHSWNKNRKTNKKQSTK